MYKNTQRMNDYLKKVGDYADRIHPGRGLVSSIDQTSELSSEEKIERLQELRRGLIDERGVFDDKGRKAKEELVFLKRRAAATGKFSDPMLLRKLENDERINKRQSEQVNRALADANAALKRLMDARGVSLHERFMLAAKRMLGQDAYDAIWAEAMASDASAKA